MIKNLFLFFAVLGLFATLSKAQVSSVTGQYLQDNNILLNPGFESGIGKWTNSAGTFTADYTNFVQGKASGKIVLSSQALTFTQDSTSYVTALADGVQGLVSVYIKSEFAAKVCSRSAGSTVTTNCVDVVGNNKWSLYKVPSILGATSNGISVNTNGTNVTGTIYIDESFVGITDLSADVDASRIAGESYFTGTSGCIWSRTSTIIGAFSTVAACPGPTIVRQSLGSWQTTDSDLPRVTINNLPAGTYKATFILVGYPTASAGTAFAINDGSSTCEAVGGMQAGNLAATTTVSCIFNYTSMGDRVYELYAASTSSSVNVQNNTTTPKYSTKFILEYFGSSSVYAATANQNNVDVFSAKISLTGVVSDENVDWINSNCIVSSNLFTCNWKSSIFTVAPNCNITAREVGATTPRVGHINGLTTTDITFRGFATVSLTPNANDYIISCQKQGADFTATRLITGQFKEVVKSQGSNGVDVQSVYFGSGANCSSLCTTGTCTICNQIGFKITSVTHAGTGLYNLNGIDGTKYNCSATGLPAGTVGLMFHDRNSSTSSFTRIFTAVYNTAAAANSSMVSVTCIGIP
jgi:hypothetical protein